MISRAVLELPVTVHAEQTDLGAATVVAVADHDNVVPRDEQLVVPGTGRIDARAERVVGRHRLETNVSDVHGEQAAAPKNYQVIAVHLHDAAFVDAGVLDVRHVLALRHV